MKGFPEKVVVAKCSSKSVVDSSNRAWTSSSSEPGSGEVKISKGSLLSGFLTSAFSIFEIYSESSAPEKKAGHSKSNGWAMAVKRVVTAGSMRRIHDRVLGLSRTGIISSTSDIWLLGVCYKISQESTSDVANSNGLVAFNQDFSSRILISYRKGFDTIGDSKFTSDVGWGCMLRSSQMLIAQALLFHQLGRSWRRSFQEPFDLEYLEILHLFGDTEASLFSIQNLVQAGKAYGLTAGSWVGPYAMCRTWESLARCMREETCLERQPLPMAFYVVSGDEDGEQGGAPVICIEDASKRCFEFSKGEADWTPILLLVPLVLGLEKLNPRYIPSLRVTFSFPQSLGIMGGKPGASTYIVGVQEDCAFYLDPHDVQPVVIVGRDNLEVDTSSYHCDVVRHIQLDSIDPSLAIGFYCRDKDDFDDFCFRAYKLAAESDGAPLFTVTQTHKKSVNHGDILDDTIGVHEDDSLGLVPMNDSEGNAHEDDWQLL